MPAIIEPKLHNCVCFSCQADQLAFAFNASHPIGTEVSAKLPSEVIVTGRTRGPAFVAAGRAKISFGVYCLPLAWVEVVA